MNKLPRALISAFALASVSTASAQEPTLQTFVVDDHDPALALGVYTHPAGGKTLRLFGGAGSGSFRGPSDPKDVVWTVGDRGPNFLCADAPAVLDLAPEVACPADPERGVAAGAGRIYPLPGYTPSIYKLQLEKSGRARVVEVIALREADGTPINGLLNPLTTAVTEIPRDGEGKVLDQDASAIDAEAIVRLPHFGGRFFIADENSTGLVEVANDGRILKRFVPAGAESEYTAPPAPIAPAGYAIDGALSELLVKRRANRGIESLAISSDMRFLYFMVQSPLDHPSTAVRDTPNIRIYKAKLDLHPKGSSLEIVGQWVYQLDTIDLLLSFGVTDLARVRDLRVSEMMLLANERFLVVERTDQATALYEIDLKGATNILGTAWDDPTTRPTLEQSEDLTAVGIVPVHKTLRLVASSLEGAEPRFAEKLEGLALTDDGRLIAINDDDFGITGQRVRVDVVTGAGFGPQPKPAPGRLSMVEWVKRLRSLLKAKK